MSHVKLKKHVLIDNFQHRYEDKENYRYTLVEFYIQINDDDDFLLFSHFQ